MLEIRDLVCGHGDGTVLDGLSLSVRAGEILAVLGHNGAGKTTLLRTIMGLMEARSGTIQIDGGDIGGLAPFVIARAGVGYVPQGREVFAAFTVTQNLVLGDRERRGIGDAFELFPALLPIRDRRAGMLSGGQQQQLAVARALIARPRVLLLDEPSEGVQPNIVTEIGAIVRKAATERAMAVLLVEQDIDLVMAIADRVAFLAEGRIVAQHPVEDLFGDPRLVDRYLGL